VHNVSKTLTGCRRWRLSTECAPSGDLWGRCQCRCVRQERKLYRRTSYQRDAQARGHTHTVGASGAASSGATTHTKKHAAMQQTAAWFAHRALLHCALSSWIQHRALPVHGADRGRPCLYLASRCASHCSSGFQQRPHWRMGHCLPPDIAMGGGWLGERVTTTPGSRRRGHANPPTRRFSAGCRSAPVCGRPALQIPPAAPPEEGDRLRGSKKILGSKKKDSESRHHDPTVRVTSSCDPTGASAVTSRT